MRELHRVRGTCCKVSIDDGATPCPHGGIVDPKGRVYEGSGQPARYGSRVVAPTMAMKLTPTTSTRTGVKLTVTVLVLMASMVWSRCSVCRLRSAVARTSPALRESPLQHLQPNEAGALDMVDGQG
jgi:hypothetical protein